MNGGWSSCVGQYSDTRIYTVAVAAVSWLAHITLTSRVETVTFPIGHMRLLFQLDDDDVRPYFTVLL